MCTEKQGASTDMADNGKNSKTKPMTIAYDPKTMNSQAATNTNSMAFVDPKAGKMATQKKEASSSVATTASAVADSGKEEATALPKPELQPAMAADGQAERAVEPASQEVVTAPEPVSNKVSGENDGLVRFAAAPVEDEPSVPAPAEPSAQTDFSMPLVVEAPSGAADEKTEAFKTVEAPAPAPVPVPAEKTAETELPDASELVKSAPAASAEAVAEKPAPSPAPTLPITADMVMPKMAEPTADQPVAHTQEAIRSQAAPQQDQNPLQIPLPGQSQSPVQTPVPQEAPQPAPAYETRSTADSREEPSAPQGNSVPNVGAAVSDGTAVSKPRKRGKKVLIGIGFAVFLLAAIGIGVTAGTMAAQSENEARNIESSEVQRTAPSQGDSNANGAVDSTLPAATDADAAAAADSTEAIQAACEHDWQPYEVSEQTSDGTAQEIEVPAEYENVLEYHTLCNTCHAKVDGNELGHTLSTGHTAFTKDVATRETVEKTPAHTETVQANAGQTIRTWSKEQCVKCNLIRDIDTKTEVVDAH